jgi:magnesium and cobalt transporter
VRIDDFVFEILRGDARQIHVLLVRRAPNLAQQHHRADDDEDEMRD